MTIDEMMQVIGIDEDPMGCAFAIAGILRTVVQGEASTFEGECASLLKVSHVYGKIDDPSTIRKWLRHLGSITSMNIPDRLWIEMAEADLDK